VQSGLPCLAILLASLSAWRKVDRPPADAPPMYTLVAFDKPCSNAQSKVESKFLMPRNVTVLPGTPATDSGTGHGSARYEAKDDPSQ